MNTGPMLSSSSTSPSALATIKAQAASSKADAGEVGKKMDAMFASMLIKSLRETLGEEGLFPGDKTDALGGLFDQFMGEQMAEGGGLGVGQMVERYARNNLEV